MSLSNLVRVRGTTTVEDIMTNLSLGELSQYAIGGYNSGGINTDDYPKVMSAINRGVNQLQADLSLHEDSVNLILIQGVLTYHIHSAHSLLTGTADEKYIWDSANKPFEDNILRIQQVYDGTGREIPINVRNDVDTVYTPSHNVIQFPYVKGEENISVVYTSYTKPTEVDSMAAAARTYLPIPDYCLPALYAFVASQMTAGMTTNQEISESQMWRNAYEQEVGKLVRTPSNAPNSYQETKLHDRGFV